MGMEVRDACFDKEPDGVIIYSNGDSHDISHEIGSGHLDDAESCKHIEAGPQSYKVQEKYEVNEYATEGSVTEPCDLRQSEERTVPNISAEDKLPQGMVKAEDPRIKDSKKSRISPKLASKPSCATARMNCTVPQPFALATERRALFVNRIPGAETDVKAAVHKLSVKMKEVQPSTSTKKDQVISRKPLQPDNKKHPDEEDTCSVASSVAPSVRALKCKSTVASAPLFRSTERAEKRKEYYLKLEEKHIALEAEKLQSEERTKEEKEAAIKQLRKNMMFKASPMPSFYHEGPPPKLELKKTLPTRAKSPKLGRRKSCSDAVRSSQGNIGMKISGRGNRHSLDVCKNGSDITETAASKSRDNILSNDETCDYNNEVKQEAETDELVPSKMDGQRNLDIPVQC